MILYSIKKPFGEPVIQRCYKYFNFVKFMAFLGLVRYVNVLYPFPDGTKHVKNNKEIRAYMVYYALLYEKFDRRSIIEFLIVWNNFVYYDPYLISNLYYNIGAFDVKFKTAFEEVVGGDTYLRTILRSFHFSEHSYLCAQSKIVREIMTECEMPYHMSRLQINLYLFCCEQEKKTGSSGVGDRILIDFLIMAKKK